jgi:hypothetical protein
MARSKGPNQLNPGEQIEALQRERVELAKQRHTLEAEMTAAQATVDAFPDRQRQALVDEARGRGEAVREVEAEAARARATVADRKARVDALRVAEQEIQGESDAIFASDAGIAHFTAKAQEASRAAEAARTAAEEACSALKVAWTEAESQWGQLRRAWKRRGEDERAPQIVPRPDFPAPVGSTLGYKNPWPGGRRPEDRQQSSRATRANGTEAAPLIEAI